MVWVVGMGGRDELFGWGGKEGGRLVRKVVLADTAIGVNGEMRQPCGGRGI